MKFLFILLLTILNRFSTKTVAVIGGSLVVDYYHAQSYTSGGNTGFNSWSVYQTNSPTNAYGNRYNCINVNRDSIVFRTKYLMLDSIYTTNSHVASTGKVMWLDGRRVMISKVDSLPISARQVTTALGFMPPTSSGVSSITAGYGAVISGSVPSMTVTIDTVSMMYTTKAQAAISILTGQIATKFNIVDTTSKWMPIGVYDRSITNEIQTLSLLGQTVSISGGNNFVIPTQTTVLTSAQVTTALSFLPYNSTNPSSYISGYTPTLSLSGQSLTAGGNTIVISTQTTVLTSAQVTTALTFVPATNTVVSDKTVAISSANSNMTVTSSYPNFTLTPYASSTFTASRAVNSATYQVSATKTAWVYYSVRINCTATIGTASSGTVILQYSSDSGSNWVDIGQIENSPSVALAAILSLNDNKVMQVSGVIPAGAIVRMVATTTGAVTITFIKGQETY